MPFPRAKASLHDQGSRVPLAIRWPQGIKDPGRVFSDPVNLSDLAPTFLQAAGLEVPDMMTATGLQDVIENKSGTTRLAAFIAMERHDGCRKGGKGYPSRAIRTKDYMYIFNHNPKRWPAPNLSLRTTKTSLASNAFMTLPLPSVPLRNFTIWLQTPNKSRTLPVNRNMRRSKRNLVPCSSNTW